MLRPMIACFSCVALGFFAGIRLMRQTNTLGAWQRAFETMRIQCMCVRNTPEQVLRAGSVYVPLLADIALQGALDEKSLRQEAVPQAAVGLLSAGIRAIMDGGQQEQEMQLAYVLASLGEMRQKMQAKCDRDARLYITLGIWSGLCFMLIL